MYQYDKHFTLPEARGLIPFLKPRLVEIRMLALQLKETGFDVYKGRYLPGFHPDTLDVYPPEYRRLVDRIEEIREEGVEVKGLEYGLVDFPALRDNGEEVFLCWKIDEDDIEFWHPLESGYKGRAHIDEF